MPFQFISMSMDSLKFKRKINIFRSRVVLKECRKVKRKMKEMEVESRKS